MKIEVKPGPRVASARRREIYLQASRLFVEKGYDATSMSDIAAAVNITKAGLYHFVKGKEDLLFTIMTFGMDELDDEVVNPGRAVADPRERLEVMIRNHVLNVGRVSSPHGNPVTIVTEDTSGLNEENRRIIDKRKRAYFELMRSTIAELKARGDTSPDLDPTVAAYCVIGMVLFLARWRRPEGRLDLAQIVDQILLMALGGVMGGRA